MTDAKNSCGHQCFIIGGPFIAEDPTCPTHGTHQKSYSDQRSESDLLMSVLARMPVGWEVRIGIERDDEDDSTTFLAATVWADNEDGDYPYDGLLFGVSAGADDFMRLAKLLREAIVNDKRITLRENES